MSKKRIPLYEFWGCDFTQSAGKEILCICPICQNKNSDAEDVPRFFLNTDTYAFQCKRGSCGCEGSWRDFLRTLYEKFLSQTTDAHYKQFEKLTGIAPQIARFNEIAYEPRRQAFIYPLYEQVGRDFQITDLRLFRNKKKEISTAASDVNLGNNPALLSSDTDTTIYLVEGFRNQLALQQYLLENFEDGVVVSVTSKNTFRDEWAYGFENKNVVVCLDDDGDNYGKYDPNTGKATGLYKVYLKIRNIANSVSYINWPSSFQQGFDVRDALNNKVSFDSIRSYITPVTLPGETTTSSPSVNGDSVNPNDFNDITMDDIIAEIGKTYKLNKNYVDTINLVLATIISSKLPGDNNVWLLLVGPVGSGKSLACHLAADSNRVLWEATLTAKGLCSGWGAQTRGTDPSILARIERLRHCCLIVDDLTQVLTSLDRDQVFSILRNSYLGKYRHTFGNGSREYLCNYSFVAGVTHAIKEVSFSDLGERFLNYNVYESENPEVVSEFAMNAQYFGKEDTSSTKQLIANFINRDWDITKENLYPKIPKWFRERIKPLARLIGILRTKVRRYETGTRFNQLIYKPVVETGNRAAVQMDKLAVTLALIQDKQTIDEEIYELIKTVALNTIDSFETSIVKHLYDEPKGLMSEEIAAKLGITTVSNIIEDLQILNVVYRNGAGPPPIYKLAKPVRDFWKRAAL